MEKDILKNFVDKNRDHFDDQLPDANILGKLQSQLGLQPAVDVPPKAKVVSFRYWWAAAAAVTIIIGISFFLQQPKAPEKTIASTTDAETPPPGTAAVVATPMIDSSTVAVLPEPTKPQQKLTALRQRTTIGPQRVNTNIASLNTAAQPVTSNWKACLQNESSSVRLAAVLASAKSNTLSDEDLKSLYFTLNNDENSNVRLAALEVLKKREQAGHLILASVDKQDDPLVQMELLASLSPAQAVKVEQQLLEITQNPLTIDAVRNEAYAVLLRSDRNL